jgi:hypothetical protein
MRHFRIFLDDVGTYDVVAREVETASPGRAGTNPG